MIKLSVIEQVDWDGDVVGGLEGLECAGVGWHGLEAPVLGGVAGWLCEVTDGHFLGGKVEFNDCLAPGNDEFVFDVIPFVLPGWLERTVLVVAYNRRVVAVLSNVDSSGLELFFDETLPTTPPTVPPMTRTTTTTSIHNNGTPQTRRAFQFLLGSASVAPFSVSEGVAVVCADSKPVSRCCKLMGLSPPEY